MSGPEMCRAPKPGHSDFRRHLGGRGPGSAAEQSCAGAACSVGWGPAWTALLLLLGWVIGAAAAFVLGRHARPSILRQFPSVNRHANIDRLIHPSHRMGSLIQLRMTFPGERCVLCARPVHRHITWTANAVFTAVGGAPFALLFALYPPLPTTLQLLVFVACALVFVAYTLWVLRAPSATAEMKARASTLDAASAAGRATAFDPV